MKDDKLLQLIVMIVFCYAIWDLPLLNYSVALLLFILAAKV